jgi:hypothetical protein
MRAQYFLLLSSIALSSPALAAEPKSAANANRPEGAAISRADAARSASANDDWMRSRPARKNRVYYTFPPSAKRM